VTRSALVIHGDEMQLRFACDALVMFNPGYRVSTAKDLDSAGDLLDALTPDLVILDTSIADPETLRGWAERHALDTNRTVLFGHPVQQLDGLGSATVAESAKLPDLMAIVRTITHRNTSHDTLTTNRTEPGRR